MLCCTAVLSILLSVLSEMRKPNSSFANLSSYQISPQRDGQVGQHELHLCKRWYFMVMTEACFFLYPLYRRRYLTWLLQKEIKDADSFFQNGTRAFVCDALQYYWLLYLVQGVQHCSSVDKRMLQPLSRLKATRQNISPTVPIVQETTNITIINTVLIRGLGHVLRRPLKMARRRFFSVIPYLTRTRVRVREEETR